MVPVRRTKMDIYKLLLTLTLGFITVQAKPGFIYTMPKTLRAGTMSQFCMTMHGYEQSSVPVTMTMFDSDTGDKAVIINDTYTKDTQKCNQFEVPASGNYELLLYNETDIVHDAVQVTVINDQQITFVQTDKPMYKPGQKVKFRILTLLKDLKPRTGKIRKIFILDPSEKRVKQYLNVETQGISSLEFQLAKEAALGEWKIEVTVTEDDERNNQFTLAEFEVKEYVLPRFEVLIKPPAYLLSNQETFEAEVCAKYTYGKPVSGHADIKVCWEGHYGPRFGTCFHDVVKISGCYKFSANATELKGPRQYGYYHSGPQFTVSVTEEGTGAIVNATQAGPSMTMEPFRLQMDDYTNGFFKPGLPFYGKVTATRPDDSPAAGEVILIKAVNHKNNLKFSRTFVTDSSGVIVYSLCGGFTESITSINIEAVAVNYTDNDDAEHEGLFAPRGYTHITQWFSPSLSYIQIPRMDTVHKCGESLTLSIPFTTHANRDIDFHYQIMTRDEVIETGEVPYKAGIDYPDIESLLRPENICLRNEEVVTPSPPSSEDDDEGDENDVDEATIDIEPPSPPPPPDMFNNRRMVNLDEEQEPIIRSEFLGDKVSDFLLHLTIKPVMSPKFTLLVYYVLPDGEVVADSMKFSVTPCFDNEVTMNFNETTVLPGKEVDIKLAAAPGSVCGVGIVDKSVNILGGKHQLTPEMVFERVEQFNTAHFSGHSYHSNDVYCEERMKMLKGVDDSDKEDFHYWYYSSLYVDASEAFKNGFMVLSNLKLETRPCRRSVPVYYEEVVDSVPAPAAGGPFPFRKGGGMSESSVRSHFPETWLWNLEVIGDSGENVLRETAPHTITNWVGNAMCLDQTRGFGMSEMTSLTTFQPFFLSLHLPYAAVRGERLPVLFTVYNYLEKCLHIEISLDMGKNFEVHSFMAHKQPFCLCGGDSYTAKYFVTPKEIGNLPVLAQAQIVPGLCGNSVEPDLEYVGLTDAVKRQMFVKAEGVVQQYSHASYICAKADQPKEEKVILPLPDEGEMVKDSARGELKVIGNMLGPVFNNLDNLVQVPSGCGEQNMVGFVPNIIVLKYLENAGKLTEELHDKIVSNMEIGYQRELSYRHSDGSFSAFGAKDPEGSVWLTAFVMKSFAQAKSYIYIDEKDLKMSLKFLRHSQLETGCFRETGKVFSSYMMGGLGKGEEMETNTALTAYVLTALLIANVNTSEPVIKNGISCMNKHFQMEKEKMDPYTLALVAYANALYQSNDRSTFDVMQVLQAAAKTDGSLKYWTRATPLPKPKNTWHYYAAPSAEVEMTAYALLAHLTVYGRQALDMSNGIATWLTQQRNPYGGFASTQDTVVGLNALAEFASLIDARRSKNLRVAVTGKKLSEVMSVSDQYETSLLLQTAPIEVLPNLITIKAEGEGCAFVQTSVTYNKLPEVLQADERSTFHLKVMPKLYKHDIDQCNRRTIAISVGTRGRQKFSSGMTLVTLKMVTSWSPMAKSLTKLESLSPALGLKRYEYDENEGILTLYFDELSKRVKFSIDVEQDRDLAVSSPKPAEVKVFQYYDTDVSRIFSYNLRTICGTKEEIPRKRPEVFDPRVQVRLEFDGFRRAPGPGVSDNMCPVCIPTTTEPENFREIVCDAAAVYKAFSGRRGVMPLKLRHDLRPRRTHRNVNEFAKYKMSPGCDCSLLESPPKRVLLLLHQKVSNQLVTLDSTSMIILTNKKLEKLVRKYRKSCPLERGDL